MRKVRHYRFIRNGFNAVLTCYTKNGLWFALVTVDVDNIPSSQSFSFGSGNRTQIESATQMYTGVNVSLPPIN